MDDNLKLSILKEIFDVFDDCVMKEISCIKDKDNENAFIFCKESLKFIKNLISPIDNFIYTSNTSKEIIFRTILELISKVICITKDKDFMYQILKDDLLEYMKITKYALQNVDRLELTDNQIEHFTRLLLESKTAYEENNLKQVQSLKGQTQKIFEKVAMFIDAPHWGNYYYEFFKLNSIVVHPSTFIFSINDSNRKQKDIDILIINFLVLVITFINENYTLGFDSKISSLQDKLIPLAL